MDIVCLLMAQFASMAGALSREPRQLQPSRAMQDQPFRLVDGLADLDAVSLPHHETFALLVCWYAAAEPGIGSRL
jgi:hypothetical protein